MSQASVRVAYDGEALRQGTMDVRELAPALLALGELCDRASRVLNGDAARVSVQLHSEFKRGSFGLEVDVVQLMKDALLSEDYKAARELLWLLGCGGPPAMFGLVKLVKFLRGRKPAGTTQETDGTFSIKVEGDNSQISVVNIHSEVILLFNDAGIREALAGVVKPLEAEGIDSLEIAGEQSTERIEKQEAHYFTRPEVEETQIADETREGVFEIVKLSFTDRYKWTFSDGNATFNADILDDEFFERLQRREHAFAKGDLLRVKVRIVTWRSSGGLRAQYSILDVIEVVPALQQIPLPGIDRPRRRR